MAESTTTTKGPKYFFDGKKVEFVDYITPMGKKVRAVIANNGFAYEWIGKSDSGNDVDVISFVERGWEPVMELKKNDSCSWWEYKGVLRRGNVFEKHEEMRVDGFMSSMFPVVETLINAGMFTLTKERFLENR